MTEIEKGRKSFLNRIEEGKKRIYEMEEKAVELSYKTKYEMLIGKIRDLEAISRHNMDELPEPEWPDTIDDRKKVIWFRNDVFEHAHAEGMLSACRVILNEAEKL